MLDANIELDNAIVAGHSGMTFGIHICRGNHKSMFYASGGYDRIAAHVFKRTQFDRYLLEYDDERSGTFEPLKHVPDDRVVVLGLISSKVPQLESEALLRERIAEASKIVPLERLALSPQCGFASTHEGNRLSKDDQRKKLELTGRVARESGVDVKSQTLRLRAATSYGETRLARRQSSERRRAIPDLGPPNCQPPNGTPSPVGSCFGGWELGMPWSLVAWKLVVEVELSSIPHE